MEAIKNESAATNTTFEPSSDVIQEEDCNTLLLYLPGFTKEQLKVQLTRTRDLKISGTRRLENNKLSSFQKDFRVPENCDTTKISAKFEEGILYVRQPKFKTTPQPPKPADQPLPPLPTPPPPPPAAKIDPLTAKPTDQIEHTEDSAEKPLHQPTEKTSRGKKEEIITSKPAEEGGEKEETRRKPAAEEKTGSDYNRLNAATPAARLKDAKQHITNILLFLFVFGLGIYVGKLPWFSKRAQD